VITRALGPEGTVDVDTRSFRARAGDVYLLCSDGLTTMVSEAEVARLLREHPHLRDAGEALIAAANDAGGKDNVTVVLLRLEDVGAGDGSAAPAAEAPTDADTATHRTAPTVTRASGAAAPGPDGDGDGDAGARPVPVMRRRPRLPHEQHPRRGRRGRGRRGVGIRVRRLGAFVAALFVLGAIAAGLYAATQSIYFIGTNSRGLITLYRGVPFKLPGGVALYSGHFVSGVSASTVPPARRHALLDHSLRSEANAAALIRNLERGELE
jgi:protein phosphatase